LIPTREGSGPRCANAGKEVMSEGRDRTSGEHVYGRSKGGRKDD
jgi:hypothetical protein